MIYLMLLVCLVEGKMMTGIARTPDDRVILGSFSFEFPYGESPKEEKSLVTPTEDKHGLYIPPKDGRAHVRAENIVHSDGHYFLILTDSSTPLWKIKSMKCKELLDEAKVVESLRSAEEPAAAEEPEVKGLEPSGNKKSSKEVRGRSAARKAFLFDLQLSVDRSLDKTKMYAVIARCQRHVDCEYKITINQADGSHFSAEDSWLPFYSISLVIIASLALFPFIAVVTHFHRRQVLSPPVAALVLSVWSWVLHTFFFGLHILAYSYNGTGVVVLCFVSQLLCSFTDVMLCLAFIITVSSSGDPSNVITPKICGAIAMCHLVALLHEGMSLDDRFRLSTIALIGEYWIVLSWAIVMLRCGAAYFTYRNALVAAKSEAHFQWCGVVGPTWLSVIPLAHIWNLMGGGRHAAVWTVELCMIVCLVGWVFCLLHPVVGKQMNPTAAFGGAFAYDEIGTAEAKARTLGNLRGLERENTDLSDEDTIVF